jgi:phosphopantothenoylcysteine decarboxylase/phosphopantothenate--cysteine ligase
VEAARDSADVIIMTAAVADYRPAAPKTSKLKKSDDTLSIELVKNPDILAGLGHARSGKRPVLVGFAMETDNLIAYARRKLQEKRVDLIVANDAAVGFGRDDTQAVLVDASGDQPLHPMTKTALAHHILDRIKPLLAR